MVEITEIKSSSTSPSPAEKASAARRRRKKKEKKNAAAAKAAAENKDLVDGVAPSGEGEGWTTGGGCGDSGCSDSACADDDDKGSKKKKSGRSQWWIVGVFAVIGFGLVYLNYLSMHWSPDSEQLAEYFNVLELPDQEDTATSKQVRRAFKRLVRVYHPDVQGGDADKFIEVEEAYQYALRYTEEREKAEGTLKGQERSKRYSSPENKKGGKRASDKADKFNKGKAADTEGVRVTAEIFSSGSLNSVLKASVFPLAGILGCLMKKEVAEEDAEKKRREDAKKEAREQRIRDRIKSGMTKAEAEAEEARYVEYDDDDEDTVVTEADLKKFAAMRAKLASK